MASLVFKFHLQTIRTSNHVYSFDQTRILHQSFPLNAQMQHHQSHLPIFTSISLHKSQKLSFYPQCSISNPTPPSTKEEAILQAKTSLSSSLEKPLNNPKLASGKLKKVKQPRFRVEIPVVDDSPSSLTQLAVEVFADIPIKKKGAKIKILILWTSQSLGQAAFEAFVSTSPNIVIDNIDLSSVFDEDSTILSSADVAVFLAPEASALEVIKTITDSLYPKPVVIFNPKWSFEEEGNFDELSDFVGSFDVVYSFMGLEVRGILTKRKGVIFKFVRDGVLSGERWSVLVEEEGKLQVVSRFKSRPSITEVETVLYNLMAINSPITKSAKFLKELVSNVTGKK